MTGNKQISRRTMLRGMGAALSLPYLEAMLPRTPMITSMASAAVSVAPATAPARLAFFYVPNGMHMPDWKPKGADPNQLTFGSTLQPVKAFRDRTTVFSGLSLSGGEAHGDGGGDHARSVASFLTGAHPRKTHGTNIRNGISVDQVAAARIGHQTRLPSLELGVEASSASGQCDTGYSCIYTSNVSWRNEYSPLAKEIDPAAVFDRIFGDRAKSLDPRYRQRRTRERQSILDFVQEDAKALQQRLGSSDRRRMDEYLYAVRDIEARMQRVDKLDRPETDNQSFSRPEGLPQEYSDHVQLLMDMMVIAFQTDATRISTFMFANAGSNRAYRNIDIRDGHHNISHHGNARDKQQKISRINQFHMTLMSHFLKRLDSVKEGDRTLLDNSMIVYGSGISDGNSHSHKDLPVAVFGSGGGAFATGRHVQSRIGTPMTNLYCSLLRHVGAPVEKFSDSSSELTW